MPLDNVNTLTGAENQQQVRMVLANVRTLVNDTDAVIVSAKPLMANIDQTVSTVSRTFDSVRGTVDSLREPLVDDLKALHDTLEDARGAIGSVQGVVRTNEDDFAETMRALRTASENLRTMSEQVKERPWSLIRTTQAGDRKVPR
jgi:ABC-type transporter Mla subunit MlaD